MPSPVISGLKFKTLDRKWLEDILKIENEVQNSPWSDQNFLSCFGNDLYFNTGLFHDNRLIGYTVLMIHAPEAELHNIAIDRRFQNCGMGKRLIGHIAGQCVRLGVTKVFLEVRESNSAAIGLYKCTGFIQTGERKNYYDGETPESAWLFTLDLRGL